jgi:hypothetical protein
MASLQKARIPEVYVLWHPHCRVGEPLARKILDWLRPGNGLGPDVFFRCLPSPDAPQNGLPLPLPGEARSQGGESAISPKLTDQQIVLALIDENMVADQAWRHWLTWITPRKPDESRVIMPVALDATAYNMPQGLRELNYLRPAGLPLRDEEKPEGPGFERAVRSLLKQVTEAMCRLLLPRPATPPGATVAETLPKVTIFLSHAKQDGTAPARRLRDYIYGQTQLEAFFDENDIAFSAAFRNVIESGLGSPNTAALIAVRSNAYATRPWCRREISIFRKPQKESASSGGAERWRLYPTVVVEAMEGRERSYGIAELGNCPLIRWNEGDNTLEELIVTTVIRDAMLASYHSAVGASIPSRPGQIIINWLPDPTTLLHIETVRKQSSCRILYPGRGLSGLELDVLYDYFPNVDFRSFEEELS